MNKEDQYIKSLMQILLGIGLFVIYKLIKSPLQSTTKWKNTNWYDPSDELFLHFLYWATLISSIAFLIIGTSQLIKLLYKKE